MKSVFSFLSQPDGIDRNDGLITFEKLLAACREFEVAIHTMVVPFEEVCVTYTYNGSRCGFRRRTCR